MHRFFLVLLRAKYRAFLRAAFLLAPGRDLRGAASCNLLAVDRNPFLIRGREILKILLLNFFIIDNGKLIYVLIVIFLDLALDPVCKPLMYPMAYPC